jgi:hypothetical protein
VIERRRLAGLAQRLVGDDDVQHAPESQVVGDPAVDEMQVRRVLAFGKFAQFVQALDRAGGRSRRVRPVDELRHPGRLLKPHVPP